MARKKNVDDTRGHGFDLAAIAAEGPVPGNDPSNGIGGTEDEVDTTDSPYADAFRRTGQANIAGLGGMGF